MSKSYGIAKYAGLMAAFGFILSMGGSLDSQAAKFGSGKGYHTNAAQVAVHKTCAGIPTTSPAFKQCNKSYPPADRFQARIMGGFSME